MQTYPRSRQVKEGRLKVVETCLSMKETYGFVSYAEVGARLGVSRQYVYKALRTAVDKGELTLTQFQALRAGHRKVDAEGAQTVPREYSLTPSNDEFVQSLAKQMKVFPAVIVNNALNVYRKHLAATPLLGATATASSSTFSDSSVLSPGLQPAASHGFNNHSATPAEASCDAHEVSAHDGGS